MGAAILIGLIILAAAIEYGLWCDRSFESRPNLSFMLHDSPGRRQPRNRDENESEGL